MDICLNCKGAIFPDNEVVGYAGPSCHCPKNPYDLYQRPASKEPSLTYPFKFTRTKDAKDFKIELLAKEIAYYRHFLTDLKEAECSVKHISCPACAAKVVLDKGREVAEGK